MTDPYARLALTFNNMSVQLLNDLATTFPHHQALLKYVETAYTYIEMASKARPDVPMVLFREVYAPLEPLLRARNDAALLQLLEKTHAPKEFYSSMNADSKEAIWRYVEELGSLVSMMPPPNDQGSLMHSTLLDVVLKLVQRPSEAVNLIAEIGKIVPAENAGFFQELQEVTKRAFENRISSQDLLSWAMSKLDPGLVQEAQKCFKNGQLDTSAFMSLIMTKFSGAPSQ